MYFDYISSPLGGDTNNTIKNYRRLPSCGGLWISFSGFYNVLSRRKLYNAVI